jgi:hypothetical protein
MKVRKRSPKAGVLFWLLLFTAYAVAAVGIVVLDARDEQQGDLSRVADVTIHASDQARSLGAAQLAALHRARSGAPFTALPPGATVRVVWPDGSSEYVVVVDPASPSGAQPIEGTQRSGDYDARSGSGAAASATGNAVARPARD